MGQQEISFLVAMVCIEKDCKKRGSLRSNLSLTSSRSYYPIIIIHGRHSSAKVHASGLTGSIFGYILCAARLGSVEEKDPTGVVDGDMF